MKHRCPPRRHQSRSPLSRLLTRLNCNRLPQWGFIPHTMKGALLDFPSRSCTAFPHVIHLIVVRALSPRSTSHHSSSPMPTHPRTHLSTRTRHPHPPHPQAVVLTFAFVGLGYAAIVCSSRPSPLRFGLLGTFDTAVLARRFLLRMLMAVASVVCMSGGFRKLLAILYTAVLGFLFAEQLRWQPYYSPYMNYIQTGAHAALCWGGLLVSVHAYDGQRSNQEMTTALFAGVPLFACAGAAASFYRLRRVRRKCVRPFLLIADEVAERTAVDSGPFAAAQALSKAVAASVKFRHWRDCEVASRVVQDLLLPDADRKTLTVVAEAIILRGLEQFPDCAQLVLAHSFFVTDVLRDTPRATPLVERARGMQSGQGLRQRFVLSLQDREIRNLNRATSQNLMDLQVRESF